MSSINEGRKSMVFPEENQEKRGGSLESVYLREI